MLRPYVETAVEGDRLRAALARAYTVLRERDPERQRELIATDIRELLDASIACPFISDGDGWRLDDAGEPLPSFARELALALLARAIAAEKSLLSTHPALDPKLQPLAARCRAEGTVVHLLLVRALRETHGAYVACWLDRDRPEHERRRGFYYYWDMIGLAVAAANERSRVEGELRELRHVAYRDRLTGLANALALEEELHRHEETMPFGVLVLDFDGMRAGERRLRLQRRWGRLDRPRRTRARRPRATTRVGLSSLYRRRRVRRPPASRKRCALSRTSAGDRGGARADRAAG